MSSATRDSATREPGADAADEVNVAATASSNPKKPGVDGEGPKNAGPAANNTKDAKSAAGDSSGDDSSADAELVTRAQAGDEAAFRALFERYHRRAFAVAYGVVKNKQDAMDVVQDGFVKVHRHIGKFQGTSSFYTWLYRIIMNLAIDHIRRRRNAKGVEYDDRLGRDDAVAGDSPLLPRIADANPGKTIVRRELLAKIREALGELPDYHRAVIVLREIEGMSYEEMSKVLGVPKGTIMSRLFHARKKMQHQLAEYMQGELVIED